MTKQMLKPTTTVASEIRDALARAEKTVTLRPERGQRVYRNVATVEDGTLCHVEEADRRLVMDVGKAVGGKDEAPNPSMVMRSALSGCIAIGIKQWAARRDVPIDRVEVELSTAIDARGQLGVDDAITPGFEQIDLSVVVVSPADERVIEEIVEASLRYSPLFDAFIQPQRIERQVTIRREKSE